MFKSKSEKVRARAQFFTQNIEDNNDHDFVRVHTELLKGILAELTKSEDKSKSVNENSIKMLAMTCKAIFCRLQVVHFNNFQGRLYYSLIPYIDNCIKDFELRTEEFAKRNDISFFNPRRGDTQYQQTFFFALFALVWAYLFFEEQQEIVGRNFWFNCVLIWSARLIVVIAVLNLTLSPWVASHQNARNAGVPADDKTIKIFTDIFQGKNTSEKVFWELIAETPSLESTDIIKQRTLTEVKMDLKEIHDDAQKALEKFMLTVVTGISRGLDVKKINLVNMEDRHSKIILKFIDAWNSSCRQEADKFEYISSSDNSTKSNPQELSSYRPSQ